MVLVLGVGAACGISSGYAGSLWREAVSDEKGMYSDKVARKVGDIVRVDGRLFPLTNRAKFTFTSSNKKTVTANPGMVGNFFSRLFGVATNRLGSNSDLKSILNAGTTGLTPGGLSNFNITGPENENTLLSSVDNFEFRMSAQVIDRLPNGNLVIEGVQTLGNFRDRVYITLRGIIRPVDIRSALVTTPPMNTISAEMIADARIEIVQDGEYSENVRKGWLQRLDEKISPY